MHICNVQHPYEGTIPDIVVSEQNRVRRHSDNGLIEQNFAGVHSPVIKYLFAYVCVYV